MYYAMGGGVGHLVRARALLHTLAYSGRVTVVTSSPHAFDPRIRAGFDVLVAPRALDQRREAFRDWLFEALERTGAERLCLDTFPAGILGELEAVPRGFLLWHVARRLRWENYASLLRSSSLRFERCFSVESLHPEQHAFLERHCDAMTQLELRDPPAAREPARPIAGPYWLVAHSGPHTEVSELVAHALEMRSFEEVRAPIYVATQCTPRFVHPEVVTVDAFPAEPYFAAAERIVTAGGFNVLRQTRAHRRKQTIVPLPRRFDDQFERARLARSGA